MQEPNPDDPLVVPIVRISKLFDSLVDIIQPTNMNNYPFIKASEYKENRALFFEKARQHTEQLAVPHQVRVPFGIPVLITISSFNQHIPVGKSA